MPGFFSDSEAGGKRSMSSLARCGKCGLGGRGSKPEIVGDGKRNILVVSGPRKNAGMLESCLDGLGCDLGRDCWSTDAVACETGSLSDDHIACCRPNLYSAINELQPSTIVLLGLAATKSLLGQEWKEFGGEDEFMGTWHGWRIPMQTLNAWVYPTWSPSWIADKNSPVLSLWFRKHLGAALKAASSGPPWREVPDYASEVRVEKSPSRAAEMIRKMNAKAGDSPLSLDFETNMLKPDGPEAEIVTCAICWGGRKTLAFPWHGDAAEAAAEVFRGPAPKIGANMKFEQRWSMAILKRPIRNWAWDCMQAAHVLDCRPDITSVKFQAFVRLGLPLWSSRIEPFLEAPTGNAKNRIREANMDDLLLYNGIDALAEYRVAELQIEEMGANPW